jgi:heterodisulfide reductase subunit C
MSESLKIHELDPWFLDEVSREPGCQHLKRCFACGVCTASCPVSAVEPDFSPSLIIRQILLGLRSQLLTSPLLWQCARCARCSFQCPQDVRVLDVIQALRRLALREGYVSTEKARALEEAEKLLADLRRQVLAKVIGGADACPEVGKLLRELQSEPEQSPHDE